ncbi:PP2C family protein-serine/threonine phosphatase [Streptomyces liangshanensis]|nr:PP2C family protein-serine/threonine phosphatase [Streptomyces liangshanensis]
MTVPTTLLAVSLISEQDVFVLRRQAKTAAVAAGLEPRDQVRLAAALSELGRDLLRPGTAMTATFLMDETAAQLRVDLVWPDERVPSAESLDAVGRLLSSTSYRPAPAGTGPGGRIELGAALPPSAPARGAATAISAALRAQTPVTGALEDLRAQTADLMAALEESRSQRDELARLNAELVETNQGVVALYTELTAELEETNRGVVALYDEEHQLALTLQRTFLPEHLPEVAGAELAVRYLAAAAEKQIGGDFYEAVVTEAGLLLAVGDVVGHSLQAAIIMGELRHALRAYAAEAHPPHVLLERLDHLLGLHHRGWTATVCVVLVEPCHSRIHVANAGHLPPLLVSPDDEADFLTEHGPLLGIGLPQPVATAYDIKPGSLLLMISDGLIETRDSDLSDRLDALRLASLHGPSAPEALCDSLLEEFGAEQEDDTIIFAARLDAPVVTRSQR